MVYCDIVTCCKDTGNYKNPTISQQINIDLLETLDDLEAKTESSYNNVTNNDDVKKNYHIALSVNDDYSIIND